MKTTKTCGNHLTDLIATRFFLFIKIKKKLHVRLVLKFEFFKSPLDLYNHKKNFEHIKNALFG
jgi:hypothetical protein